MKKTTLLASFPFHTLLFSVYPIIYLYSQNFIAILAQQTWRAMMISFVMVSLLLIGFQVILRNWQKAGLLMSLLTVLFFSFGHAVNALEMTLAIRFGKSVDASIVAWSWLAIFLIASFFIIRSRLSNDVTIFLNLAALILTVLPCITVATQIAASRGNRHEEIAKLADIRGEVQAEAPVSSNKKALLPDIYHIILDGYERADKLQQYYGFDNSAFVGALEQRGFYVAGESRSNYLSTTYSLNTSMNMVYFHDFPKNVLRQARSNLRTNHVTDFLRAQGYKIVVFDSSTEYTNDQYADEFVSPDPDPSSNANLINPFELLLIRTTLALDFFYRDAANNGFVEAVNQELKERRERITHGLQHLPDYTRSDQPHYLFLHIHSPHVPFLYGPNGSDLTYRPDIIFYWYQEPPQSYVQYYNDQVSYINKAVLPVIDQILATSVRPVVIILQSDHGDDKYLNWNKQDARGLDIRTAILNAVYFSDGDYSSLYPTVTPVNTYRLVLNHWFGTRYPLLPDKVYAHPHILATGPTRVPTFEDACPSYGICPPSAGQSATKGQSD